MLSNPARITCRPFDMLHGEDRILDKGRGCRRSCQFCHLVLSQPKVGAGCDARDHVPAHTKCWVRKAHYEIRASND
jgi:hypothetical protein